MGVDSHSRWGYVPAVVLWEVLTVTTVVVAAFPDDREKRFLFFDDVTIHTCRFFCVSANNYIIITGTPFTVRSKGKKKISVGKWKVLKVVRDHKRDRKIRIKYVTTTHIIYHLPPLLDNVVKERSRGVKFFSVLTCFARHRKHLASLSSPLLTPILE